ncbi:MAG: 6-bladed beta-propeller [Bacteroidota bacterium]
MYPEETVVELSDSTFLTQVGDIKFYDERYYISDYSNNRLLILDQNLKVIKSLGSPGRGPGENLGVGSSRIYKDTLYVYDDGNSRIHKYSVVSNEYLSSVSVPFRYSYGFDIYNDAFYSSQRNSEHPMAKVTLGGREDKGFGKISPMISNDSEARTNRLNAREVFIRPDGEVVSLFKFQPLVELYSKDLEMKSRLDLSDGYFMKDFYKFILSEYRNGIDQRMAFITFRSASEYEGNLHVLFHKKDKFSDTALVLNIDAMQVYKLLNFKNSNGDRVYGTAINVSSNGILVFDGSKAELHRYEY